MRGGIAGYRSVTGKPLYYWQCPKSSVFFFGDFHDYVVSEEDE
jgi:hypothetical protein